MTHELCSDCIASLRDHQVHARLVQDGDSQIVLIMAKDQETTTPTGARPVVSCWKFAWNPVLAGTVASSLVESREHSACP